MSKKKSGRGRRLDRLRPAPGDLRVVQEFVNTADLLAETDDLTSPQMLAEWLILRRLLPPGTELTAADLERTVGVRERLRSLLAAGPASGPEPGAALGRLVSAALLRARIGPGGRIDYEPAAHDLDGAFGRLLAIISAAQLDGLWPQIKTCDSSDCRAAFYDFSQNHSAKWCHRRCGNRISQAYHRRRRQRPP